jgi:predicted small lipoprotein YifL
MKWMRVIALLAMALTAMSLAACGDSGPSPEEKREAAERKEKAIERKEEQSPGQRPTNAAPSSGSSLKVSKNWKRVSRWA